MHNTFFGVLRLIKESTSYDCGGGHDSLGSPIREERIAELAWMTQTVVAHIAPCSPNVGLFSTEAAVLGAARPAHWVE